mmetsp:Transcript_17781/g.39395  ORF Transcript_17781/g.39395 Transcript_17781/m.39395 type:complete len:315 (-) Transcript_17781:260-1204(-)
MSDVPARSEGRHAGHLVSPAGRGPERVGTAEHAVAPLVDVHLAVPSLPQGQPAPQHVIHGVLEYRHGPVGGHALGPSHGELQPAPVIGIDGKQGRGVRARGLVQGPALGVSSGVAVDLPPPYGVDQDVPHVLVDQLLVAVLLGPPAAPRGCPAVLVAGRRRAPVRLFVAAGRGVPVQYFVGVLDPERLRPPAPLGLGPFPLQGGALHVRGLDHVLEQLLYVGERVDDRLAHRVVPAVVVSHEPLCDREEAVLVPRQGVHEQLRRDLVVVALLRARRRRGEVRRVAAAVLLLLLHDRQTCRSCSRRRRDSLESGP